MHRFQNMWRPRFSSKRVIIPSLLALKEIRYNLPPRFFANHQRFIFIGKLKRLKNLRRLTGAVFSIVTAVRTMSIAAITRRRAATLARSATRSRARSRTARPRAVRFRAVRTRSRTRTRDARVTTRSTWSNRTRLASTLPRIRKKCSVN